MALAWPLNGPANDSCIESNVNEQTAEPTMPFLEIGKMNVITIKSSYSKFLLLEMEITVGW